MFRSKARAKSISSTVINVALLIRPHSISVIWYQARWYRARCEVVSDGCASELDPYWPGQFEVLGGVSGEMCLYAYSMHRGTVIDWWHTARLVYEASINPSLDSFKSC